MCSLTIAELNAALEELEEEKVNVLYYKYSICKLCKGVMYYTTSIVYVSYVKVSYKYSVCCKGVVYV